MSLIPSLITYLFSEKVCDNEGVRERKEEENRAKLKELGIHELYSALQNKDKNKKSGSKSKKKSLVMMTSLCHVKKKMSIRIQTRMKMGMCLVSFLMCKCLVT